MPSQSHYSDSFNVSENNPVLENDEASNVHLECESTGEDGGQEDGIPADEGPRTAQWPS